MACSTLDGWDWCRVSLRLQSWWQPGLQSSEGLTETGAFTTKQAFLSWYWLFWEALVLIHMSYSTWQLEWHGGYLQSMIFKTKEKATMTSTSWMSHTSFLQYYIVTEVSHIQWRRGLSKDVNARKWESLEAVMKAANNYPPGVSNDSYSSQTCLHLLPVPQKF